MTNSNEIEESHTNLLEVGFTLAQIARLSEFRKDYIAREMQELTAEQRRLDFMRWLVATGRLAD